MLGSDIGGYRPGERFDRLFVRWAQLGALSPLMENGGRGEHRPWRIDDEVVDIYRYYAKLHHQLVPYLYSYGVEAHLGGRPIIRYGDRAARHYRLGEDLFVAPIVTRDDRRRVELPRGSRWYDYWDDAEPISGGAVLDYRAPMGRAPIFVKAGAIVPMQVSDAETGHGGPGSAGALTLLFYPDGASSRLLRPAAGIELLVESRRTDSSTTLTIGPSAQPLVLRIKEVQQVSTIDVSADGQPRGLTAFPSFPALDGAPEGWAFDAENGYLWVRLPATADTTTVTYAAR
jgi:alpha-glucosidase (family GH31 glycosyl hydrolase)